MEIKQVYELVNDATKEIVGEDNILKEDLSNVVDIGTAVMNANAYDKYVNALVNKIGKTIFVNRAYRGGVPSVLMDGWEFGSVLEKVHGDLFDAEENESWQLEDGTIYEQDEFYKPRVEVKFFNSKTTFEIPVSITELQVKQSLTSAEQLNAFVSMIQNEVEKSLTVKIDALIMRTINNFIGETLHDALTTTGESTLATVSTSRAVNLLKLYNDTFNPSPALTTSTCMQDKEFIRFIAYTLKLYASRMAKISRLFNIGGKARFTPRDLLHIVMLDILDAKTSVYLQSDTFHKELVALPSAETVAYWQGSGESYAFADCAKIDVKTASGHDVSCSGVLAVMWDRDALGVCNQDRRVTSHYNAKAEFFNYWYKHDASYFNDFNENFVVFFIA